SACATSTYSEEGACSRTCDYGGRRFGCRKGNPPSPQQGPSKSPRADREPPPSLKAGPLGQQRRTEPNFCHRRASTEMDSSEGNAPLPGRLCTGVQVLGRCRKCRTAKSPYRCRGATG